MNGVVGWVKRFWPGLVIGLLSLIFYYPVWTQHKIPFPGDITVGVYYPWYDYKWLGYNAGVPVKNPLISDVPSVIYPERLLAFEQIKLGVMPLWNNLIFSGYPLMATFQSAVFYPLNFLYFLMPTIEAWSWGVILQTPLAMGLMFLFLRNLNLSRLSALLGSVAYSFGGFMIFWLEYNVHSHVAAMIPLLLWLIDKYCQTKRLAFLVGLAVTVAVQIFAGYPQLVVYSLVFSGVWASYRLNLLKKPLSALRGLGLIYLFVLLGLCLAAIQLVPGQELFKLSQRVVEDVPIDLRLVQPQAWITIFVPSYFGSSAYYNFWGPGDFTNTLAYSGMVTFFLAWLSLSVFRIKSEVRFFWVIFMACLVLISDTSYNRFLWLNIMDKITQTTQAMSLTRAFIFVNLSLAVLAGFGFEQLRQKTEQKGLTRLAIWPVMIMGGVVLGTLASYQYLRYYINSVHPEGGVTSILNIWVSNYLISLRNLVIPAVICVAILVIALGMIRFKGVRGLGSMLVMGILILEMFSYAWKITPFGERGFVFPSTPVLDFLESRPKPDRMLEGEVIPSNMWMPYHLETAGGYDAVYPYVQAKYIALINNFNDPDTKPMLKVGKMYRYDSPLVDLANSRYILAHKYTKEGKVDPSGKIFYKFDLPEYKLVFEDRSVVVLENTQALPRAFMVTRWDSVTSDHELFTQLLDKKYPFGSKVLLSQPFDRFTQSASGSSSVKYLNYGVDRSEIAVTSDQNGLLFVSDTFFPGWKATVDGVEENIIQADYAFRAIPVTAGQHLVKMYYQPESFEMGWKISLFSFGLLIGLLVIAKVKKI